VALPPTPTPADLKAARDAAGLLASWLSGLRQALPPQPEDLEASLPRLRLIRDHPNTAPHRFDRHRQAIYNVAKFVAEKRSGIARVGPSHGQTIAECIVALTLRARAHLDNLMLVAEKFSGKRLRDEGDCCIQRLRALVSGVDFEVELEELEGEFIRAAASVPAQISEPPELDPDAMLGSAKLAERFGRPLAGVKKALERWRQKNTRLSGKGWAEVPDRGQKDPQYIYRVGTVREIVLAVSCRCPAKKKSGRQPPQK
jgi:hypothetical protein